MRPGRHRTWRTAFAVILGGLVMLVGVIYWLAPYLFQPSRQDYTGLVMLLCLGIALGFGTLVLIRGTRDF